MLLKFDLSFKILKKFLDIERKEFDFLYMKIYFFVTFHKIYNWCHAQEFLDGKEMAFRKKLSAFFTGRPN